MPELAFVVFEEEKEKDRLGLIAKPGMLKTYIGTALFHLFKKKKFQNGMRIFEYEHDTDILIIKMPFPLSILTALNIQYIEHYIIQVYSAMGCKKCFIPDAARMPGGFEKYSVDTNSRCVVYKALLLPILDEIYSKNGIRLDNLDIAFINGENTVELLTMIKQLEPLTRYINVASSDKEAVESELTEICADSGISIFVSSNFKSILRNADIVINLGEVGALSKYRIKPGSLMINFFSGSSTTLQGEFILITGVKYTFPDSKYDALGEDIQRSFSKEELTEILMAYKAGLLNGGSYNDTTTAFILNIFKGSYCRITGFNGRRGELRLENVLQHKSLY